MDTGVAMIQDHKCNGVYLNQHGEFGKVIHPECIGCLRRASKSVVVLTIKSIEGKCPQKLEK